MWGNDAMTWRYKIADFFGLKKSIVALVAITLLIAESHPEEKDILTRVVINLINRRHV